MDTPTTGQRHCPKCGLATALALCPTDGIATIVRSPIDMGENFVKPGDVVAGRYRIIGLLGRGGFGAVCSAEHTGTGQAVALKYLAIDPASTDDDVVKRFFQEARITSSLRHANTVRVFDFGQSDNGALYMAMERLHGPTLEQVLRDHQNAGTVMTETQAIDLAIPITRALGEAHSASLVHRDLKPANLMLAEVPNDDPIVKVLDFGIARAKDSSLTGGNKSLGTPAYMSPEQCMGTEIDGRADLYSLGIILFRCVTGRLPFNDANPLTLMYMHNAAPLPDLRSLAKTPLSDAFVALVQRALAKSADERFADARAMRTALEEARGMAHTPTPGMSLPRLADAEDGPTHVWSPGTTPLPQRRMPSTQVPALTQPPAPDARPKLALWLGLAALGVGVIAVVAALAFKSGASAAPVAAPVQMGAAVPQAAVVPQAPDAMPAQAPAPVAAPVAAPVPAPAPDQAAAASLVDEAVNKRVAALNPEIQACFEAALKSDPTLTGKVTIRFRLSTGGVVSEVSQTGANAGFATCVTDRFLVARGFPALNEPREFAQSYLFDIAKPAPAAAPSAARTVSATPKPRPAKPAKPEAAKGASHDFVPPP